MIGNCSNELDEADIAIHYFGDDGSIPNNPTLPLLIYPDCIARTDPDPAGAWVERFASHGWLGAWRNGIFSFPHYHSTAHEVLGICTGEAKVRLGGDGGLVTTVKAGDALVLPAGTGHQNLGSSADFVVVGAYPNGMDWDLCRGALGERPNVLSNIQRVSLPKCDPLQGSRGPLLRIWRGDPNSIK